MKKIGIIIGLVTFIVLAAVGKVQALPDNAVIPLGASVQTSDTWITVSSPFSGDTNANSYTVYEYSTSSSGPWTQICGKGTPGESAWRHCAFGGLTPDTDYFVQVTFVDPDGVVGSNPQIIGPVRTDSASVNAVTIGTALVTVQDTYILVSVPISKDSNTNSRLESVEVATTGSGPWTKKCGPFTSFSPKLCRIHGLSQGSYYFVRVTVSDSDGVNGPNPQVIGPIQYTGLTNIALGKVITADSGWGCCPNPGQLVDGRIQDPDWNYGFAWKGGTYGWAGGSAGWKQATIDLGSSQTVRRLDWWTHNSGNVPTTWKVLASTDGVTYTEVFSTTEPRCRTTTQPLNVGWAFPSCSHSARFGPVTARFVRYIFDDRTLFDGIHGWAAEIEVFSEVSPKVLAPPVANANGPYVGNEGSPITFDGSGSSDPDGTIALYEWDLDGDGQYDDATGVNPTFTWGDDYTGTIGLKVTDDGGLTDTDSTTVTVNNVAPTVDAGPDVANYSGQTHQLTATFTDPGVLDTHTATIDWGDGSLPETAMVVTGTVIGSHVYFVPGDYTITVTVFDDDEGMGSDSLVKTVAPLAVQIDIKPGSFPNSINLRNKGNVPVGVFTGTYQGVSFDATTVDRSSLEFAGAPDLDIGKSPQDLNADGDMDMVFHFDTQKLNLTATSIQAILMGKTTAGIYFKGSDSVNIVGNNGNGKGKK